MQQFKKYPMLFSILHVCKINCSLVIKISLQLTIVTFHRKYFIFKSTSLCTFRRNLQAFSFCLSELIDIGSFIIDLRFNLIVEKLYASKSYQ